MSMKEAYGAFLDLEPVLHTARRLTRAIEEMATKDEPGVQIDADAVGAVAEAVSRAIGEALDIFYATHKLTVAAERDGTTADDLRRRVAVLEATADRLRAAGIDLGDDVDVVRDADGKVWLRPH